MSEPLYLAPRLESRAAALLDSPSFLHSLTAALGSPLNVVLPDQIADNVRRFQDVYARHRLAGRIAFAHKANRSSALVRRLAALAPAGGGTAGRRPSASTWRPSASSSTPWAAASPPTGSPRPARRTPPSCGWPPAPAPPSAWTPPANSPRSPHSSSATGCPCVRDAAALRLLLARHPHPHPAQPLGIPADEADALLDLAEKHRDSVELTGISFHLDTMALTEKAVALEGVRAGPGRVPPPRAAPRAVDIGGGFGVDYLADGAQWEAYTTELTRALLGKREPITWEGHGYGLRGENGTLRGALGVYPGHRPVAGPRYLDELLGQAAPALGRPLATCSWRTCTTCTPSPAAP